MNLRDMRAEARTQLGAVVATFGPAIADDSRRFEGAIRDRCANRYRREVAVLVMAAREGIAAELCHARSSIPLDALLLRCTQRFEENTGLDAVAARWAVESWAVALGLAQEADLKPSASCPACGHRLPIATWVAGSIVACPHCGVNIELGADGRSVTLRKPPPLRPSVAATVVGPALAPVPAPPPSPTHPLAPAARGALPSPAPSPSPASRGSWRVPALAVAIALVVLVVWAAVGGPKGPVQPPGPGHAVQQVADGAAAHPDNAAPERWSIAAVRANLWSLDVRGKPVATLDRGTNVEVLEAGAERARVRTAAGVEGWLDRQVAIPSGDAVRLTGVTCARFVDVERQAFAARWKQLIDKIAGTYVSRDRLVMAMALRSPEVAGLVNRIAAAGPLAIDNVDRSAANWYRWASRSALDQANATPPGDAQMRLLTESRTCSNAAIAADPTDVESQHRLGLTAFRLGDKGNLTIAASVLPYLAPRQATTWAIVAFDAATDPAFDTTDALVRGAFVQLLRSTDNRNASLDFLHDAVNQTSNAILRSAVDNAIQETAPDSALSVPSDNPATPAEPAPPQWRVEDTQGLLQKANAALNKGSLDTAEAYAKAVLAIHPDDVEAGRVIASIRAQQSRAATRLEGS